MEFQSANPSLLLSPFIKRYWGLEGILPNEPYTQRIIPNGLPELIFYLGGKPDTQDKTITIKANTLVCGHKKSYYDIIISNELTIFSILFNPQGLKEFFNIPSTEFFNQNIPLNYLLKNETDELETKLMEADTFTEKVKIVETFLITLLKKEEKQYERTRIIQNVQLINQTKGVTDINFLASKACLSRKQYERIFAESIGTSPKQFLRTVRFQHALAQKAQNKSISLTSLAIDSGYYDQSHMINDFKNLSGLTPTEYFAECEPTSDYFDIV